MKIFVINSGSTSIKFKLYSMPEEKVIAHGKVANIGQPKSALNYFHNGLEENIDRKIENHKAGLTLVIERLLDEEKGAIKDIKDIKALGHRVVNIGDRIRGSAIINDRVISYIEECLDLAPLHNPPNLTGIKVCRELFGSGTPNVAVFDNIFHQDIPEKAYLYGIPYNLYEKYKIRKYGFHGIAYKYMVEKVSELTAKSLKELKIVATMLGGGSSITAFDRGRTLDTSMGFTPAEGLLMSTRTGDLDPAIIPYIMKKEHLDIQGIDNFINKRSGLFGLSGKFRDYKDIEKGVLSGDNDCIRAFNSYCYRIKKYIGSYVAVMNGIDIIVFGGGIGENSPITRKEILKDLDYFKIYIDPQKNKHLQGEGQISASKSEVAVFVANVDEELIIARETYNLLA
ncbi:MAG: acetate kinase [Candidatus Humimicrobiaceae bacterium]